MWPQWPSSRSGRSGRLTTALRVTSGAQAVQTRRHPRGVDVDFLQLAVLFLLRHRLGVGDDLDPRERFEDLPRGPRLDPPPHAAHAVVVQNEEARLGRGVIAAHSG